MRISLYGCNSVIATTMAAKLGDYVITEAGFGADLGAEKLLDIKARAAGIKPEASCYCWRRFVRLKCMAA